MGSNGYEPRWPHSGRFGALTPSLIGQELRRFLWLSKTAYEARRTNGVRLKHRRDGMPQALHFKTLYGLVLVKVLEASSAAHPDHAALHLSLIHI